MRKKKTKNKSTTDVPAFTQSEIKDQGKVYTPMLLCGDIVSRFNIPTDHKICDPSMGQGNFLRTIFTNRVTSGMGADEAFQTLYGFELDAIAVSKAMAYFTSSGVSSYLVRTNLLCVDALTERTNHENEFDCIIGNPPYVRRYSAYPMGIKLCDNLADAFVQVGMEMLVSGGVLIYITQDSFITNEKSTLREYLSKYDIRTMEQNTHYSKQFRKHDIAVDICLMEVRKQPPSGGLVNVMKNIPFTLNQQLFEGHSKWVLFPSRIIALGDRILQNNGCVSDVCRISKGRLYNNNSAVPPSYGSKHYSKQKTAHHNYPVLSEKNTGYYYPVTSDPKVFTVDRGGERDVEYQPFITLPYFTSNFRFCYIDEDILTTPLLYILDGQELQSLLPLLNSSVVDFCIRLYAKSRDTGYEFKKSTFDVIPIPKLTTNQVSELTQMSLLVKSGDLLVSELDDYICSEFYNMSISDMELIHESKTFWFKKNVITLLNTTGYTSSLTALDVG